MSATAASGDRREPGRIRLWIGHWEPPIFSLAMIGAAIWGWFFPVHHRPGFSDFSPVVFAQAAPWLIFLVVIVLSRDYHDSQLCLACVKRMWDGHKVESHRRALRLWHSYLTRIGGLWLTMAGLLVLSFFYQPDRLVMQLYNTFFTLALVANIYIEAIHDRLRPWCPYCKPWDDEGEEELTPEPDPSNKLTVS